jgi:hypothetical protein
MGNSESQTQVKDSKNKDYFKSSYNWIPSFPMKEYDIITEDTINKYSNIAYNEDKHYIDLRNNCPPIIDVGQIPLHPIATIASLLNYQLTVNKLSVFPPSLLFIYKNCAFYKNVDSLLPYEVIFKSIEHFGVCSENDFKTTSDNLDKIPDHECYKKAEPYKFINIYRVENCIKLVKQLLQNDIIIAIGITLYCDINKIIDKLWIPDFKTDKRLGGLTGLLVGYIDNIECFIVQLSFGKNFGQSGYIMLPYNYIKDKELVSEIYHIDFNKARVEGYLNQQKELISLDIESISKNNSYFS